MCERELARRKKEAANLIQCGLADLSLLESIQSLPRYPTTQKILVHACRSYSNQSTIMENSCEPLKTLLEELKKDYHATYRKSGIQRVRKHINSDEIERAFRKARKPLEKLAKQRQRLVKQQNQANKEIQKGLIQRTKKGKGKAIQTIEASITELDEKKATSQQTYVTKANDILSEYQESREKRLERLQEHLLQFLKAIDPSPYFDALTEHFDAIIREIKDDHAPKQDLSVCKRAPGMKQSASIAV